MIAREATDRVALSLFDCGAFKDKTHPTAIERNGEHGFLLKRHEKHPDDPLSPFYMNLRTSDNSNPGPLGRDLINQCVGLMRILAGYYGFSYERVCGLPHAGEPFAEAYCWLDHKDYRPTGILTLNKQQSEGKRQIVGPPSGNFLPRDRVLVIDDLITEAHSKLEGIKVLEEAGLVVKDVLVMLDRRQGGAFELQKRGYQLHAVFTLEELLGIYHRHNRISGELHAEILAYVHAN